MIGDTIGHAHLKTEIEHSTNLFAPLSTVAGRRLPVWESNRDGDCLCFVDGNYLMSVDHRDIESFTAATKFSY